MHKKALERFYVSSLENKEYNEAVKLAETFCLTDPNNLEYLIKLFMFICNNQMARSNWSRIKTLKVDAQYIPAWDSLAHAYGAVDIGSAQVFSGV